MKRNTYIKSLFATIALGFVSSASAQVVDVDYGIYYTQRVQDRAGGSNKLAAKFYQDNSRMRNTFTNSISKTNMRLRAFHKVNYNDAAGNLGNHYTDLQRGNVPNQRNFERNRKLDINILVTIGTGGFNTPNAVGWAARGPYGVIHDRQAAGFAMTHEVGHCFNGQHGQAHRLVAPNKVTVMWPSLVGNMISFYSNTVVKFQGTATGISSKNNTARIANDRGARSRHR